MTDLDPRLVALFSNPAYWRGAAASRDGKIMPDYERIAAGLAAGKTLDQIPEFQTWYDQRVQHARSSQAR